MNIISRILIIATTLIVAALPGRGQGNYSATTGDVVLSGAATKFTIQQPAANALQVRLLTAVVYCSVPCDISQAQNGAAATATAGTANALLPTLPTATATVWTGSNVGAGTTAGGLLHLAVGERVTLDLSGLTMGNTGSGTNYTIATSSITGTANITLFWREQ